MKHALVLVLTLTLLTIAVAFISVENRFLRLQGFVAECPTTEKLPVRNREVAEQKREETIRVFGIDPYAGPAGALKLFGRPRQTIVLPEYPGLEHIHGCSCIYNGLDVTFFNGVLGLIAITEKRWSFPIGVHIGDTEQRVYRVLGDPKSRLPFGINQVQLTYQSSGILTIETTRGSVTKIV